MPSHAPVSWLPFPKRSTERQLSEASFLRWRTFILPPALEAAVAQHRTGVTPAG